MTHRKSTRTELHTIEGCPKLKLTSRWTLQGRSKASDRSGFALLEAGVFFDAGLSTYQAPRALLLTHTHTDHSFALPMIATGQAHPFPVFLPKSAVDCIKTFLVSTSRLSECTQGPNDEDPLFPIGGVKSLIGMSGDSSESHQLHSSIHVRGFPLIHRVPAIGYQVYELRSKLLEEFQGLPGKEIARLKKEGKVLSHEVEMPIVSYLCDTTIEGVLPLFEDSKPPLSPVVLIECTYINALHDSMAGNKPGAAHLAAEDRKHIEWDTLELIVASRTDIIFGLIHFSMRYKEEDLKTHFQGTRHLNILLWLDEGVWHPHSGTWVTDLTTITTSSTTSTATTNSAASSLNST